MLIKTKLTTAPLKSRLLFRKTLVKRLCEAEGYPLILISGPAGSGKTTLVCQWISQAKLRSAWYSLDEDDNDPDLFFRYLLTTLAQTDYSLDKIYRPILDDQRALSGETVVPILIESLSTITHDIHIVLDDFHWIANGRIHAALARIIQYSPARLHLVLLSRYCIPAPIGAVALKKERLEISAQDLKFTEEETADLYKEVIPLAFSPAQIHDLDRHVEGWAAGLQFIGLSAQSHGHLLDLPNILNQVHEQVANYLIQDILCMQSGKVRNFVFTTALLDRFDNELCVEVTGMPDAAEMLARLERMNFFLVPLDADRKWHRYHRMFSEVVRWQAARLGADSTRATLCKAAKWLARNNYVEEALRCAFRSDDFEFAADLMEDHILGYAETFDLEGGLRWILKLPESVLSQHTLLRLQQCGFLSILTEFPDVKEILSTLEINGRPDFSRYSGDKLAFCQDLIAYFKCMLHIFYAEETAGARQLEILRNKFCPGNPLLGGYIDTHIAFRLIAKGDLASAESCLEKPSKTAVPRRDQLMKKKIYHAQASALIAKHRGRLHQAEAIILEAMESIDREGYGRTPLAFLLHRHLGNIFYLRNNLKKARECAAGAVKYCEYFGLLDEIMAGDELELQLHLAAGENELAAQCIQKIQAYSIKLGMPKIAASAEACAARLALCQGNLTAAELWSRRRNLQSKEPFSLLFAMECLTQARLFYAQGRFGNTAHLLGILRHRCAKRTLAELVLQIDILHSATCHEMNRPEKATTLLQQALAFSETEGYVRPFVNDSQLIAPVLKRLAEKMSGTRPSAHLEKVLTACDMPLGGPSAPSTGDIGEKQALTQREIEILRWVAQGFQNKEIAQRAFISITTVKSHVSNVLEKLKVKTRTQAILKAKEMQIL